MGLPHVLNDYDNHSKHNYNSSTISYMRIYVTVMQEYRDLGMKSELSVAVSTFVTPTTLRYVRLVFQRCPFFLTKNHLVQWL